MSVTARRFRCKTSSCRRSIFTERFGDDVLAPRARRTARLDDRVHHLALALGGRPAAALSRRLMMPVSNDTLLRVVRRFGRPTPPAPKVIGIDDWGPGSATSVTGRSFATSSAVARSSSFLTGSRRLPWRGSLNTRKLLLSPETAVAAFRSPPAGRFPMLSLSPIAGI